MRRSGIVACALLAAASPARAQQDDPARVLRAGGVVPTADGIARFLHGLRPTPLKQARIAWLIDQLDDPRQGVRERASLALLGYGPSVRPALAEAARGGSLEVRTRARALLDEIGSAPNRVLVAAGRVARRDAMHSLAVPLLHAAPLAGGDAVLDELASAIGDLATLDAFDALSEGLEAKDPEVRFVAVRVLGAKLPDAELDVLRPMLDAVDLRVRFEAALALARRGRLEAVPTLVAMLSAQSEHVREAAQDLLVELTGTRLGYDPEGGRQARWVGIQRWRGWLRDHGAELRRRAATETAPVPLGVVAYWLAVDGAIVRCEPDGRITRRIPGEHEVARDEDFGLFPFERPERAALPTGGTVWSTATGEVVAVDARGAERWRRRLGAELEAPFATATGVLVAVPSARRIALLDADTGALRRTVRPPSRFSAVAYEPGR